jgi:hypothetical protein
LGEVSLPGVEPCIDQYLMIGLLKLVIIARRVVHRRAARPSLGLVSVCLKCTGLCYRGAADLIDVRIPVTNVMSQSPRPAQVLAPRVFHLHRHAITARIFDLKHHAIVQALVPRIFHLNHHSTEQVFAPRVFRLKRRDPASRIFHLNHPVIWQSLAPDHFLSKLR